MPAIRKFCESEFNVNGYIYSISISSRVVARSSDVPIIAPEKSVSRTVSRSSVTTSKHVVFHSSLFDIVLERILSLISGVVPRSIISAGVGIPVSLQSTTNPRSSVIFNINSVFSIARLVPVSNVVAKYIVPNDKKITFGDIEFIVAKRASPDKITPLTNSKMSNAGIDEPLAYTTVISISAESNDRMQYENLMNMMGKKCVLSVYGIHYENAYISGMTDKQWLPKLSRWGWVIEFTRHVFGTTDTAQWGEITLSNPTVPNSFDINPNYSVDMGSGIELEHAIPRISEHYALECLTESQAEHTALLQSVGTKQTLVINGKSYPLCYISSFSYLQPRGGGDVYGYTIEFSREVGVNPVSVSFDGVVLPNCSYAGNSDLEIIQNRVLLYSGKTAVDLGNYVSRSFTFSCMSNDRIAYDQLMAKITQKLSLSVDGETFTKMYISQWSDVRIIGDGDLRIYQWQMTFDQETV